MTNQTPTIKDEEWRYADADAVEVFNEMKPRLGRLLRGTTRFAEVEAFEAHLAASCESAAKCKNSVCTSNL